MSKINERKVTLNGEPRTPNGEPRTPNPEPRTLNLNPVNAYEKENRHAHEI
jgi:hypothetical protein